MCRATRIPAADLGAVGHALEEIGAVTAIIDVEPMLVAWNDIDQTYVQDVQERLSTLLSSAPSLSYMILVSNSKSVRPGATEVAGRTVVTITNAHKPWRVIILRSAPEPVAVIGDQPLTDGLLAWRLGASFVHWQHLGLVPWWPRFQGMVGAVIVPFLFKTRGNGK